jgi:hypothetical protein
MVQLDILFGAVCIIWDAACCKSFPLLTYSVHVEECWSPTVSRTRPRGNADGQDNCQWQPGSWFYLGWSKESTTTKQVIFDERLA